MTPPRDAVALIDMDGTTADYDLAMSEALRELRSPGEPEILERDESPWIEARRRLISRQPGFWRNLRPYPTGFDIVRLLRSLDFELHVLTKGPKTKPSAWTEKREWCSEHLPDALVTVTEDKSLVWGKVLVDDWPEYFMSWLRYRPRGVVIVPAQPWNVQAEMLAPANIFRYDPGLGFNHFLDLERVLCAVRDRLPGQSIDVREIRRRTP